MKPIWLNDQQAIARFKQEAKTTRKLRHSHIIDVYDVGEIEGQVYLTELLVEGKNLAQRLANGSLEWDETLSILTSVGAALDYAHSEGIIHRDIKPTNILLGTDNVAYLSDFGLVRAIEGSASLSASSSMIGTGHYMAPEIWEEKEVSPAIDVYALSCVAFEMLTGKVLFDGSSMMAVLKKHADGPKFPDTWAANVPDGVAEVLQRGLAENPAERFRSAGEMIAALETLTVSHQTKKSTVSSPAIPHQKQSKAKQEPDRAVQTISSRLNFRTRIIGAIVGMIVGAIIGASAVLISVASDDVWVGAGICGLAGAITGALCGGNPKVISVAVTGVILTAIIWIGLDNDPLWFILRGIVFGGSLGAILGAIIGHIINRFVKSK